MARENYEHHILMLKTRVNYAKNKLIEWDKYKDFEIDESSCNDMKVNLKMLGKQRIAIMKGINEVNAVYNNLRSVYDVIMQECQTASSNCKVVTAMNDLESSEDVTGLINSLEAIITFLEGVRIEIDETIKLEKELNSEPRTPETSASGSNQLSGIKLTHVEVPEFDGESENFAEFIASFAELVHLNKDLSVIEKAIRLKNALKGKAALCIKGIPVTSDNYEIMYKKVEQKYQKKSVNKHVIAHKLENLPVSGNSAEACSDKLSEIEVILNQLDSVGMSISDSNNLIFHRMILKKFPIHIREKIIGKTKDDEFTVENLIDALENEIFTNDFMEKTGFADENTSQLSTSHQPHNANISQRNFQQAYVNNRRESLSRVPLIEEAAVMTSAARNAEEGRHSATPDEGRDRSGTDSKGLHLYAVLGLPKDCNEDDIKRAYRKLALRFHPDKISGDDPARHDKTEKFKEINHANAILSNPKKRKIYDQMGEPGLKLMEQFGEDNERLLSWMLKPWFKWVFFGFGLITCGFFCCCCGCMCCCKCCCNFCCGKYTPAESDEFDADDFDDNGDSDGPHVIVVQPGQPEQESASPRSVDPSVPPRESPPSRPAVIAMPPPAPVPAPEYGTKETSQ